MTVPPGPSKPNAGTPWVDSDLLFLQLALERGMSFEEVAGFLGREAHEVRQKAEEPKGSGHR
jgi:hypothetical protein